MENLETNMLTFFIIMMFASPLLGVVHRNWCKTWNKNVSLRLDILASLFWFFNWLVYYAVIKMMIS